MLQEYAWGFARRHGLMLCAVQDARCVTRGITLKTMARKR